MERVQAWFERIVGISFEEQRRRAFVEQIFTQYRIDTALLERPACWRRSRCATVGHARRM